MMKRTRLTIALCLFAGLLLMGTTASAESLCWNMSPYVDIVCFDIGVGVSGLAMHGSQSASGSYRTPVDGAACYDEFQGVILIQWDYYGATTGFWAELGAYMGGDLNGYWNDSLGGSGEFIFVGAGPMDSEAGGPAYAE